MRGIRLSWRFRFATFADGAFSLDSNLTRVTMKPRSSEADVDQTWEDAAERRYQRYLRDEEEAIPAAQALAEIRIELGFDVHRPDE